MALETQPSLRGGQPYGTVHWTLSEAPPQEQWELVGFCGFPFCSSILASKEPLVGHRCVAKALGMLVGKEK